MKRDCRCPRARHQHGTRMAYELDHCRCFPCRRAAYLAKAAYARGETWTDGRFPSSVGVVRRLQALHTVGWSRNQLAQRLGCTRRALDRYSEAINVLAATHERIGALYDELWNVTPTGPRVQATKNWAARSGFVPPLAWDDDEIDDPNAQPHTPAAGGWDHQPCGTAAAERRHRRNAEPIDEACKAAARRYRAERRAA